jgi:hypothetical protein
MAENDQELKYSEEVVLDAPIMTEGGEVKGLEWLVTIIRPGVSLKRTKWSMPVLEEAASLYEGIQVGVNDRGDHEEDSGVKRVIVGLIKNVKAFAEGLKGTLDLSKAPEELRMALVKAYKNGTPMGLSHVVHARHVESIGEDGKPIKDVQKILRPEFVDLVLRPSAGGSLDVLVAGLSDEPKKEKEESPVGDPVAVTTAAAPAAATVTAPVAAAAAVVTPTVDPAEFAKLTEALNKLQSQSELDRSQRILTESLVASGLPEGIQEVLKSRYKDKTFTESVLTEDIETFRKLLDTFGAKAGGSARTNATITANEYDAYSDRMTESLFHTQTVRNDKGEIIDLKLLPERLGRDASPKKYYVEMTGDDGMTGRYQAGGRLTESIASTTFASAMGDSITRALLANYRQLNLDSWRQFVRINRVTDFRTQRRDRLGGYANFPTVAQGASYNPMTSPTDQEATYVPTKRGGTEDLTMEAIANDDLNALREIPRRMARAAAQTLHEFVYDFLRTGFAGSVSYDANPLFHAAHGNLAVTALSLPSLIAARMLMLKQTDMTNAKRLGIRPRFLIAPIDLEEIAYQLTTSERVLGSNFNDPNFARQFGLTPIIVEYWSDTNDWFLVADPADAPTIEVGFFNGQEEPEMFVQDMPTVGNVFSNDKITYKLRHIYGAALLDHRAFTGNNVP